MGSREVQIRSERPGDEDAIDIINCRAFREMEEAHIVRLMRANYPAFDRRYSVTAWDGDEMVGHTLFSPGRIRLMGETVSALAVGPVAVAPERQRQGIGGKMLQFGHELGEREGFALAYLCGHPTYYPKYGYRACFGFAKVTIDTEALPEPSQELIAMPVRPADIPWLCNCFGAEWADVDFSWQWGNSIVEWVTPVADAVLWWTDDGRRAGYTLRVAKTWRMVLADDADLAQDVIATVKPESLEQHPAGWLAKNVLNPDWGKVEANASTAAMAYELQEGIVQPYLDALEAEKRMAGFCSWPLPFITC